MAENAGLQVISETTGSLVIDQRFKTLVVQKSGTGWCRAVTDNDEVFELGDPVTLGNSDAALIVYTADGSVAFDSRQQTARYLDQKSGNVGPVPNGMGTYTYPAGRKYAVMVLENANYSFPVMTGGSPGAYYWKWRFNTLKVSVAGNQITIAQTAETDPEPFGPAGLPSARGKQNFRIAILDVTGYTGAHPTYVNIGSVTFTPAAADGSINVNATQTVTSNSVTVSWTGGNAGSTVTWSKVSGTTFTAPSGSTGTFSTTAGPSTTYTAVYRATVSDGTSSAYADITVTLKNTYTGTSTLGTPTASISPASVVGGDPFTINWSAVTRTPSANGTVQYTLWYRYDGGAWASLDKGTSTTHAGTTDSTMYGRNYEFYVVARDNGGNSANSNTVALAITAPSVLATPSPSAPATAKVGDWFNVTWGAVTRTPSPNGTVIYKVHITDNGVLLSGEWDPTPGPSGLYLSANVTSANVGHTYGYSVQARDSGGNSSWSAEIFVTCTN